MDAIDPETKAYLKRILNTVFIGLFWMMAQVVLGIFLEYGLLGESVSLPNVLYYAFFIITLFFLARYYIKIWSTK